MLPFWHGAHDDPPFSGWSGTCFEVVSFAVFLAVAVSFCGLLVKAVLRFARWLDEKNPAR